MAIWGVDYVKYVRVYADATGESHFEDLEMALTPMDFAPPAPPHQRVRLRTRNSLWLFEFSAWLGWRMASYAGSTDRLLSEWGNRS